MPTTVDKVIGTGGDYSDPQSWFDDCPADLRAGTGTDQIWRGKCKNQTFTGSTTRLTLSGKQVDSTHYVELTTDTGASFADNIGSAALRASASYGTLITSTGPYNGGRTVVVSMDFCRFSKLQITNTHSNNHAFESTLTGSPTIDVDQCIVEGTADGVFRIYGAGQHVRNSLIIQRGSGRASIAWVSNNARSTNCDFVAPSDIAVKPSAAVRGVYGTSTHKNSAFFGATALTTGSSTFSFTTCYTDLASPPSGVTQTTYSSAFTGTTASAMDLRLKAGSALIDAGTTDSTFAANDILGTARPSGSAYDVGCHEVVAGGGSTSVNVTGQAATMARGTMVPALDKAFTGLAATSAQGTLAPALSVALTGQVATGSPGTMVPAIAVALTGQVATTAQGNLSPSGAVNVALTGITATATQGTMVPAVAVPLTGLQAATAQGSVTPSGVVSAALTGLAATVTQGTTVPAITVALTGLRVNTAQGNVTPDTGTLVALTGLAATTTQGALGKALVIPFTGQRAITTQGTTTPAVDRALTGQQAVTARGNLGVDVAVVLTGLVITSAQGSLTPQTSGGSAVVALTGLRATTRSGVFSFARGASGTDLFALASNDAIFVSIRDADLVATSK